MSGSTARASPIFPSTPAVPSRTPEALSLRAAMSDSTAGVPISTSAPAAAWRTSSPQ